MITKTISCASSSFPAQEITGEATTTNSTTRIGARRNHLNFALPDISSSAFGWMRLFYVS